jgi:serine protease Do
MMLTLQRAAAIVLSCAALSVASADAPPAQADLDYALSLSRAFKQVAGELEPSVVHITSLGRVWTRRSMFDRGRVEIAPTGLGSGVIVSEDGLILTNSHVVREADELVVRLTDGRQLDAEIIGADPVTDLAVLRIEADGLVAARFGDSDALSVGEWVLAIGSPFGFENSVTAGIVSATGRAGLALTQSAFKENQEFIQTDASINPGNSGGPLVNLHGEIVGINTAIASRTGGSVGIGFATPSAIARLTLRDILDGHGGDHGRLGGWLGIEFRELERAEAVAFGVDGGVLVTSVAKGGPNGTVRPGDVLLSVRGRPVRESRVVSNVVALSPPGTLAEVELLRDGTRSVVSVPIKDREEAELALLGAMKINELGITVAPLNERLAGVAMVDPDSDGVVVIRVESGSIADRSWIQPGDVIYRVEGLDIEGPEDLARVIGRVNLGSGVRIYAYREGQPGYFRVRR